MASKKKSAKEKIIDYYKAHPSEWIHNQELRSYSGANDTPRTIRALKQEGWQIEVRGDGYTRLISLEKVEPKGIRGAISRKDRYLTFHRDGNRCKSCGRSPDDGVKLTVDHIIPVDWDGKNELDNYQTLCEDCNYGKQAWVAGQPPEIMKSIMEHQTVESRIEALFEAFPNQDVPSTLIHTVSRGAFDWQRALRRVRQRTGKKIEPDRKKLTYRYFKE